MITCSTPQAAEWQEHQLEELFTEVLHIFTIF
jgi:hypothetical protein